MNQFKKRKKHVLELVLEQICNSSGTLLHTYSETYMYQFKKRKEHVLGEHVLDQTQKHHYKLDLEDGS